MLVVVQTPPHENTVNPTLQIVFRRRPSLRLMQQPSIVVGERVRHLLVNRKVANLARGIAHAQRNAENVSDEDHDQRRPNDVPADDEKGPDDLEPDLFAVAVDGTTGVGQSEGCAASGRGEDAGADAADECAYKVCVEDIEGVIDVLEERDVAFAKVEGDLVDWLACVWWRRTRDLPRELCRIQARGTLHPSQRRHRRRE
jgi:hypothetical protein